MKHIEINIGKACNNKCRFCMSSKVGLDEKELTKFAIIKGHIDLYSQKGYKSIGYLGGDISIHPKINEIIRYSKEKGFEEINIITNGMIFSDYEKALKIVESGVTRVNISIHSHNNKIEDYLTQVPGGLEKKIKAIDNFNDLYNKGLLKSPVSINIVLNKKNFLSILNTCIYFFKIKKIIDIRINFIWNRYFFEESDNDNLSIKFSEILDQMKKIIHFSLNNNLRITFDSIPPCIFYKIDKKNYIKLINIFLGEKFDKIEEVSNINKNIVFNWKKQKTNSLKIKTEKCKKCFLNKDCEGVWKEYIKKFSDEDLYPII